MVQSWESSRQLAKHCSAPPLYTTDKVLVTKTEGRDSQALQCVSKHSTRYSEDTSLLLTTPMLTFQHRRHWEPLRTKLVCICKTLPNI